uniref:PiggyBac transposable element-derived protein domain-containing protein n=1 Tax=Echeneis naucrates TaxID=173247 RepID=A0A665TR44_ECHNA
MEIANITDYPEWQASLPKSDNIKSPYKYFKMFFSEDILEVVVEQSNLYAIQRDTNNPLNLTAKELEQFMGTLTPCCRRSQWVPKLAVDKQMVPFKGRNRLKQYLPSKPKKCGYKILVLAGSDGVLHNFEIYTGRVVQTPELPDVGASGNVVLRLAQPIPKQQNYKVFTDNCFTSVPLILTLAQQGIHCTGTVRSNRLPGVNLMCDAELKRTGRGSFEQKTAMVAETTLHAVKWYDKRSVSLVSNYIGAHPVTDVDRWDGKRKKIIKVPCPAVVREYNKDMGGVDLLDSLIALYCSSTGMKTEEQVRLYTFKSYVAESLCKSGKNLERKRGRTSSAIAGEYEEKRRRGPTTFIPVPDVHLDATAHWMVTGEKQGRCKVPGRKGTPKTKCQKCDAHLCFTSTSNCFMRFHTE